MFRLATWVRLGLAACACVLLAAAPGGPASADNDLLRSMEQKVATQFGGVRHITHHDLDALTTADPKSVVVLDARAPEEFAVSHLPGSKWVGSGGDVASLTASLGDVSGKTIVVYCSVGYRSSVLASAAKAELMARGARDVVNLKGGVFGWHNASRPLEADGASTDYVHPYSASWGRLLDRPDKARMGPGAVGKQE